MQAALDDNPALAACSAPMLGAVITPTGLEGSPRASVNVVPGKAVLRCDCRILPGQSPSRWAAVAAVLDGIDHEFTFSTTWAAQLAVRQPAVRRDREFMPQLEPGASLAPTISSGFTDSHYFRTAFGNVAYGFMPKRTDPLETWPLIHSFDERVPKDDLELGAVLPARRPRRGEVS